MAAIAPDLSRNSRLGALAWALYETGRTPYFVLVNIYVFAPYFTRVLVGDPVRGQSLWGLVTAGGALLTAVLAPLFGAVADAGGPRKPWLLAMTVAGIAAMCALWWARPGVSLAAPVLAVILAGAAFELSVVFHNALLADVVASDRIGRWSGMSFAGGNLASILVMAVFTFAIAGPVPGFGLSHADHGPERAAGLLAAAWFAALAWPIFLFTPDRGGTGRPLADAVREGAARLAGTVGRLRADPNLARYLLARMVFNDGFVVILYFAGIYAGGLFGWRAETLTVYGVLMGLSAVTGAVVGGRIDDRIGSRATLLLAVGVVFLTTVVSISIAADRILWLPVTPHAADAPALSSPAEIAFLVNGVVCTAALLAGIASSRSFLARLAPPERLAEVFGLFALSGNAMAFLAPLTVGLVTGVTHSQQWGLAVTLAFLGVGFLLLLPVREAPAPDTVAT